MKIDPYVLDAIKGMDLPKLLEGYGIALKPTGRNAYQASCPFHEDKTPSLSVGFKNNKWIWNCFGCRARGNALDFRIAYEKIPFSDAYTKCADELRLAPAKTNGSHTTVVIARPAALTMAARAELLARAADIYHEAFKENLRGANYLAGRGIKDGELVLRHKIGFVDGRLRRVLPEDPDHEFVYGLKEIGILNDKGSERFQNCVIFRSARG